MVRCNKEGSIPATSPTVSVWQPYKRALSHQCIRATVINGIDGVRKASISTPFVLHSINFERKLLSGRIDEMKSLSFIVWAVISDEVGTHKVYKADIMKNSYNPFISCRRIRVDPSASHSKLLTPRDGSLSSLHPF